MASLYVGDLHPNVTESMLLNKFGSVGKVHSIRLCRVKSPGTSQQYAFVNFQHWADAERALDLLNFDPLLGQPMRIMWSRKDSSRKNNVGNIFIKNLEKSIDSIALYNTFSIFGNILSCKVMCDENGSKGYGYVHFESAQAAETAIRTLNGMLFNDHKVFITHFKSRQERQAANRTIADETSKQVHVSQVQKKEEGHPSIQHAQSAVKPGPAAVKPDPDEKLTMDAMREQSTKQSMDTQTAVPAPARKPLTLYMLESADVEQQVTMLHEYLLPLVEQIHPTRAREITCMVIQGENNYNLLDMVAEPNLLRAKVEQMVAILQGSEAGQNVVSTLINVIILTQTLHKCSLY
ncbi:hypothetical protein KOW79_000655 [Hemibagrus wyckioides]|uniref:Polyadenylate-binding protein 1-like n=1 Tax=Hemibagrus wyckioides TaxID=337641 RepID=A0A9D3STB7_9TELE|nr:hypothetical protein KOW79_000655 [Hemibagrus wyckioides]